MFNSITSRDLGRARQRQLLDEAFSRRFRRSRRVDRLVAGRGRSVPGSGAVRPAPGPS